MNQLKVIWIGISSVAVAKEGVEVLLPIGDWHIKSAPPKVGQLVDLVWNRNRNGWMLL